MRQRFSKRQGFPCRHPRAAITMKAAPASSHLRTVRPLPRPARSREASTFDAPAPCMVVQNRPPFTILCTNNPRLPTRVMVHHTKAAADRTGVCDPWFAGCPAVAAAPGASDVSPHELSTGRPLTQESRGWHISTSTHKFLVFSVTKNQSSLVLSTRFGLLAQPHAILVQRKSFHESGELVAAGAQTHDKAPARAQPRGGGGASPGA